MSRSCFRIRLLRTAAAISVALLVALPGRAADLELFKNYFVTGDFATVGKGIRGTGQRDQATGRSLATTTLTIPTCPLNSVNAGCVPGDSNGPSADIVAAFLYWESLEKTDLPSSAFGYVTNNLGPDDDPDHSPQCSGGRCTIVGKPRGSPNAPACWSNGGSTGSSQGAPTLRVYRADVLRFLPRAGNGKRIPSLQVWLSDSGSGGNDAPLTEGVSMFVVYRHTSMPYKGVVILDGAATMNQQNESMTFTMNQFYQTANNANKISFFAVGNGQSNFPEIIQFGTNNNPLQLLARDPFVGSAGPNGFTAAGGYSWDNLTYDVSSRMSSSGGDTSVTIRIGHDNQGAFDCISVSGIAGSFTVPDRDGDGLLDPWELNGFTAPGSSTVLVPLNSMGADVNQPDLFVEIDYMVDGSHSEKPTRAALDLAGDGLKNIGIRAHFDIGSCATTYPGDSGCATDPYLIRTGSLEGGDTINETAKAFYCQGSACVFPNQQGLIFWRTSMAQIAQATVSGTGTGKVYFNPNRDFLFHYVVFAHGLAMPAPNSPANPPFQGTSASGRGDLLGKYVAVTVGKWANRTDIGVAGTLLHELGHNMGLYHGGTATGANCNVVYVGVMNYLHQTAGTLLPNGRAVTDYSLEVLPPPAGNENSLNEFSGLGSGTMQHRLRWYAPRSNVATFLGINLTANPNALKLPSRHCDGTSITDGNPSQLVRVDGFGAARSPIDWNYNGVKTNTPQQDIDFNGVFEVGNFAQHYTGLDDRALIAANQGLRQLNSARGLFGLSLGVGFADLAHNGEIELGEIELGEIELGEIELGEIELGEIELGEIELGEIELGEIELGEIELGALDEMDETISKDIGTNLPPTDPTATAVRQQGQWSVTLTWVAPPGTPTQFATNYHIYRSDGAEVVAPLTKFSPTGNGTTFVDTTVDNNRTYTYFIVAQYNDGSLSGPSDTRTVSTSNQ